MPALLRQPVPNREAAAFIKDKPVVSREVFDGLLPEIKARAFVITGVEDASVVQAVRDRIAEIPQGADWDTVKAEIADQISHWLAPDAGAKDDEGNLMSAADREEKARAAAERRAELLLRGHGFQAYAAAQYEVMDRQRAAFPFWQYLTSQDDRVRDSHAALDGLVLPADSPFWATHFPPWDYGCRCQVVPLQAEDVADMQAADADKKPEERRVLSPERQAQLEKSGIISRALPGDNGLARPINVTPRADAPRFEPGTLKLDVAQLRERYDAPTFATFEKWARATPLQAGSDRTVLDWLAEPKPARPRPVPVAERVSPPPAAPAEVSASVPDPAVVAKATTRGEALALISLPPAQRGTLAIISTSTVKAQVREAANFIQSVLHRAVSPAAPVKVRVAAGLRARGKYLAGVAHVRRGDIANTIHELAHHLESVSPVILAETRAFVQSRTKIAERPQWLGKLTGNTNYRLSEIAIEDDWVAKGGDAYTGKVYPAAVKATEVLTMGLERMYKDPAKFARDDPEFFRLILKVLRPAS